MKKVVKIIYQTFLPNQGRFPRVSGQARILGEGGYQVTVLCCRRDGNSPLDETVNGMQIRRIPIKTWEMRGPIFQALPLLLFMTKAFLLVRKWKIDCIHCHNLDVLPLGYLLKKLKRCRLVFEAHEPNYYALWPDKWRVFLPIVKSIEAFFSKRADFISVTNNYQVDKYMAMGVKQVEIIGNYPALNLRARSLTKRTKNDTVTFGRIGTLYHNIGIEQTVKAFAKVIDKYPQTRLLLAGRVVKGYEDSLKSTLAPIREVVDLYGPFSAEEMPDLYKRISVSLLIYPKSDWFRNITPRKYFDSVANGVPVIMTDIGGLGDTIHQAQCGLVVDDNDIDGIACAISNCICDRELINKMSRNALRLAKQEYSWERMAKKYLDIHEMLLNTTRQPI